MAIVWRGKNRIRPIHRSSGMNRLETNYRNRLEGLKLAGEIQDYRFEAIKFRLADRTYYTPDFLVVFSDRIEIHECKGFMRDDAAVKLKVAAEQFPWFGFKLVKLIKRFWHIEEV